LSGRRSRLLAFLATQPRTARPTQELIPPNSEKKVAIVIQKMAQYPDASNPKNVKDKFLVQSMKIDGQPPELADLAKLV
jgi:hypothetical protein